MLESEGIPVYLRGEFLAGGIGELPVSGFLALCVHEVFEQQARDVLARLESDRALGSAESEEMCGPDWAGAQPG